MTRTPSRLFRTLSILPLLAVCGAWFAPVATRAAGTPGHTPEDFANVLDIRADGASANGYIFADLGTWHAYGFNNEANPAGMGGFRGPAVLGDYRRGIRWLSEALEAFTLRDEAGQPVPYARVVASDYLPGRLRRTFVAGPCEISQTLIAVSPRTTMTVTRLLNTGPMRRTVTPGWTGKVTFAGAAVSATGTRLFVEVDKARGCCAVAFPADAGVTVTGNTCTAALPPVTLEPGAAVEYVTHTAYSPDRGRAAATAELDRAAAYPAATALADNTARWQGYLDRVFAAKTPYLEEPANRDWAVKSMMTLTTNWRSAAGDLHHAGMYPATGKFDAFWAWDSWEHAAAVAIFHPELAKDQMLTLFDHQTPEGMIIDLVALEKRHNNTACSKPPIAGWGAYLVYQRTGDKEFVRAMYPKLVKYHDWRYKYRDHDRNGLCEYGGIRGDVVMGQWESGMDVAVKFDGVKMLQNAPGAWSYDQESVELNCYLCAEKFYLAALADVLGEKDDAARYRKEGASLRDLIRSKFYDEATGYFYDIRLGTGEKVKVVDISGWIPLLTRVATPGQAARVKAVMEDRALFGDYYPFSSLNHKHPAYHPERGYFRGQTWINYVYFGIRGFKNYGYAADADRLTRLLPRRLAGLDRRGPALREHYSSATGAGLGAEHFGWSSAFSLLLLTEDADRFPYVPDAPPAR